MQKNNIILRALEPEDIDLLMLWENDPEIWSYSNTLAPFSRHILKKYIESAANDIYQNKQLRLMIDVQDEEDRKTIGCIDLFDFDPYHLRAGVGILIAEMHNRNKGFGRKSLNLLKDYAFRHLQLHQLYCNIGVSNTVSIRLFESSGFVKSGVKKDWNRTSGGYEDEYFLQCIAGM